MTEHNPVEAENKRFALLVIVGGFLVLPALLSLWLASVGWMLSAYHFVVSCWNG